MEAILKRDDGTRVKITVEYYSDSVYSSKSLEYKVIVSYCNKGKRTWMLTYNADGYKYRKLSMEERRIFVKESYLDYVTEKEILEVKLALWESIKPI